MRRPQRPSAAVVIACVALAVAIGGTGIAAIAAIPSGGRFTACYQTSDSILNRIVVFAEPGEECPATYARVTWPAESTGGVAGPQGPPGPVGPAGHQGPPGPAGASSLAQVRLVTKPFKVPRRQRVIVGCRSSETAIGGGYLLRGNGGGVDLANGSYPWWWKGRSAGWIFEPRRIPEIAGRTFVDYEVKKLYITRQKGHNHEVHYREPPFVTAIPNRVENDPPSITPFEVNVYALCAGR